jgi:hypothetical protein
MARDIHTTSSYQESAAVPPETIERRLGKLIRYYVRTRSPAIAQSVVRHIEQLCAHPGYDGEPAERCAYLRLRAHWRWLARSAQPGRA